MHTVAFWFGLLLETPQLPPDVQTLLHVFCTDWRRVSLLFHCTHTSVVSWASMLLPPCSPLFHRIFTKMTLDFQRRSSPWVTTPSISPTLTRLQPRLPLRLKMAVFSYSFSNPVLCPNGRTSSSRRSLSITVDATSDTVATCADRDTTRQQTRAASLSFSSFWNPRMLQQPRERQPPQLFSCPCPFSWPILS